MVHSGRECTPPYLSTGISNLFQPAQAEVVSGQLSTYLASWDASLPPPQTPTLPDTVMYNTSLNISWTLFANYR